ncbi:MAG: amidohydrolase family protein, partial [Firmicutes bacterium]|nr:amidohydrolase family protein [Bacillota bacterium]
AKAQGRTDCGVIAEGKKADLIVFDLDKENLTPDFNTVSNIVFAADTSDIWMTMCDGRVICKEGKSLLIDEEETKAKALESFNKVLASL